MSIDERLDALVMNAELQLKELEALRETSALHHKDLQTDAENIRALARIAEIHERRLTDLEGFR
ncbi:MAG TPA: hypothetical protein VHY84_05810 [Bryobacteraceae bacterium]|jgi:hypothetical protein|nr:hypothetical protein [Bryobacteraceae bacterium]